MYKYLNFQHYLKLITFLKQKKPKKAVFLRFIYKGFVIFKKTTLIMKYFSDQTKNFEYICYRIPYKKDI